MCNGLRRDFESLTAKLAVQYSRFQKAMEEMGEIEYTKIVKHLIAALEDENARVREKVVKALGKIKDTKAVEPLISMLKDEDSDVRWSAIWALGEIGSPSVEQLIAKLNCDDPSVKENVALALCMIKDKCAVDPLLATLKDVNLEVRIKVAHTLINRYQCGAVERDS